MRRSPFAVAVLATGLAAVTLAGCGSSSPAITEDASGELELRVQAVRDAAGTLDRALADEKLAELVRSVNDLRRRDEISADRADKVLDAANIVRAQLLTIPTTTTTTTTTTTLPPTTFEPDEDNRQRENGNRGRNGGGDGGGGGD
jgi:hypothetical protein